jgi:hypothetical protein
MSLRRIVGAGQNGRLQNEPLLSAMKQRPETARLLLNCLLHFDGKLPVRDLVQQSDLLLIGLVLMPL